MCTDTKVLLKSTSREYTFSEALFSQLHCKTYEFDLEYLTIGFPHTFGLIVKCKHFYS